MDNSLNISANEGSFNTKKNLAIVGDGNITTTAQNDAVVIQLSNNLTGLKSISTEALQVSNVVIDQNGINAGGQRISNIANAVAPNDAVNLGQLNSALSKVNQDMQTINNRIDKVEDRAYAGIAASNAMSMITPPSGVSNSVGVGFGQYANKQAVAIGYSYTTPNNKWRIRAAAAANGEKGSVAAGVNYSW